MDTRTYLPLFLSPSFRNNAPHRNQQGEHSERSTDALQEGY